MSFLRGGNDKDARPDAVHDEEEPDALENEEARPDAMRDPRDDEREPDAQTDDEAGQDIAQEGEEIK